MNAVILAGALLLSQAAVPQTPPPGFVVQLLEPLGGKILRPKEWFYVEQHRGPVYMWILSKEDISQGESYTTGVRIQVFSGLKQAIGKTPRQFIEEFASRTEANADELLSTCGPEDQGMFTRSCLETLEGPHHIQYSLFWGSSGLDIAVVWIGGTTQEAWETYSSTFDRMKAFELIDMERFPR